MRHGCIMSPWLFNVYMDAVMKDVKIEMEGREVRFQEESRKWRVPGLLYSDNLVLCREYEGRPKSNSGTFC